MIRPTTPSNPSQLSTPPRSTTFPDKPAHKHRIPHRSHHHHHHHHDKSVPHSAILPTTSNPFGDFLSKTNTRIDGSADGSKTPPRALEQQQQPGNERANDLKEREREKEKERETWKEVERLRVRRKTADDDLRTRLTTLSTLSTTTTRRLDYTYYSLLSSMSSLTSAVSSLSSLSAQTSTLQKHFTSSSSSLTSEIKNQIASSNKSLDAQAQRVFQLGTRIREGREKVGRLGERLDGVREKVEKSSLRDQESRRMMSRRRRMLCGSLGFLFGLLLILAATRQWRRNEETMRGEIVRFGDRTEAFEKVERLRQEIWEQRRARQRDREGWRSDTQTSMRMEGTTARSSAVDVDATLRLFDEL